MTSPPAPTVIALTIAGSDSGGGAGIQADLKTFSALGVYGATVIAALTAQNTKGVSAVFDVPPAFVGAQIDAVFADLAIGAVKIGMLGNAGVVRAVAEGLARHRRLPIVLDPVMVATSGDRLLTPDAVEALRKQLLPLALVVTPNLPEAAALLDAPQAASEPVAKVVASAAANAENNLGLNPATLVISTAYVDEGATMKRFQPRAQGRAFRIRKRTSHITIEVESVPTVGGSTRNRRKGGAK